MRSALVACCIAGCLFLGSNCTARAAENAGGTASGDLFAPLREQIKRQMAKSGVPSLSVAVALNGKIIWEEAFGWADVQKKVPATVDTMYSLASVSKPITATGLMALVERGKLDLDAPVNNYLAKDGQMTIWIGDPKDITLRRVASHTAGLPRHEHFFHAYELASMPAMDESIRRYGNVVTLPGERYRYSNFGYGILSHVIARASGTSFADFMRQEIFLPLGMNHSSVDIPPDLAKFASARYEGGRAIPFYSCDHAGASSVWSSAHDLARFGTFLIAKPMPGQETVLSRDSIAAMFAPAVSMRGPDPADTDPKNGMCYGLGWQIYDTGIGRRINHTGGMGGAASALLLMPEDGLVVAAVSNTFCDFPSEVVESVVNAVFPDYEARQQAARGTTRRGTGRRSAPEFKVTPELQGDWEGHVRTYAGDFPITLSFKESGAVQARLGKQAQTSVTGLSFVDGWLSGSMAGRIETPDARMRIQSPLNLDLKLRGDALNGAIVATIGNALSYWVELRKK